MDTELAKLKQLRLSQEKPITCLLNLYIIMVDEGMGWHSDGEKN
jgi:alkylated DNA repair dioxygenase AlkB